ncbi:MAG: hypothetical protein JRI87_11900 [Deltaproteobacteria bacterium]|nr:hypothetical protein [Deltaproteobacteria bacterium]
MNVKKIFYVVLLVCIGSLIFFSEDTKSQETVQTKYRVIRLLSDEIIPSTAIISLGTVLIWVNEAPETAEIIFTNVGNIATSCDGSARFNTDSQQVISAKISFAGLESLCLIQKGEFNYTVKRGSHKLNGKIITK